MKRPISIYLGVLLILLRSITTIFTAVGVGFDWKDAGITLEAGSAVDEAAASQIVLVVLMALFGLAVAIDLVMARLIFGGSNRARFVAMSLGAVMILGSGFDFLRNGTSFTLENGGLLGLTLDILALVALSSDEARDFTTGNSNVRRAARRSRRLRRGRRLGGRRGGTGGTGSSGIRAS